MIPKTDRAVAAIKSGVEKFSFVDGRVPHAVLPGNFYRRKASGTGKSFVKLQRNATSKTSNTEHRIIPSNCLKFFGSTFDG